MKRKSLIELIKENKARIISFAIGFSIQLPISSQIIGFDINKKIIVVNLLAFIILTSLFIILQLFNDYMKRNDD